MTPAPAHRVAVAVDGSASHDSVLHLFDGDGGVEVGDVLVARPGAIVALDSRRADALVVVCATPSREIVDVVAAAAEHHPWLPVLVACRPDAGSILRDVLAVGADDVVALPGHESADSASHLQLCFALEKAIALRAGVRPDAAAKLAEVVTVLGPKGGTGKTLTSCNLAVALSRAGQRVGVVDLDLQFGDVGLSLAMTPTQTIYDLASTGGALDAERLGDYLVQHDSGARVLLAPTRPDQASAVTPDLVRSVVTELRRVCDVVVIDTPPGFTPEVIAAIDASTALCMVCALDSLSLKNTRLALDTLGLMGYPDDAVHLVLNRADSRVGVHPADVQALLGRWPDILVPSHRDISRAVNEGTPIVARDPGSEAARAFVGLARAYCPDMGSSLAPRRVRHRWIRGGRLGALRPSAGRAA